MVKGIFCKISQKIKVGVNQQPQATIEKKAEKTLGGGKGCIFGSSPNWFEWPHLEEIATMQNL